MRRRKYSLICLIENSEERYIIKDPFKNSLEEIIKGDKLEELSDLLIKYNPAKDKINSKSKAQVIYVSPDELPSGVGWKVLGQYDPRTHTIYIANNLSPDIEDFVYYHEEAHSLGIKSERLADDYAASKVGFSLGRSYDMAA